jgi:hypothetical protein
LTDESLDTPEAITAYWISNMEPVLTYFELQTGIAFDGSSESLMNLECSGCCIATDATLTVRVAQLSSSAGHRPAPGAGNLPGRRAAPAGTRMGLEGASTSSR